jgi:DNA-binding protein WhiA
VSLTAVVRAELAALPLPGPAAATAELSGLLRCSGVLRRHGGADQPWSWLSTLHSIVGRRADRLLLATFGERCQLRARRVTAPRPMLLVELVVPEHLLAPLALDVGSVGAGGGLPAWLTDDERRWAYVRGTALAGLRLADPRRPHCEVQVPTSALAEDLAALLTGLGVRAAAVPHSRDRWRVVSKARPAIGTLLAGVGATSAFLQWEEERARRSVRGAATRGANADRANVERSVSAATAQVATAERALAAADDLDDELVTTALARLANPTASLRELAAVLGVSRATVSRRFRRLAAEVDGRGG